MGYAKNQERRNKSSLKREEDLKGDGLYVFQNPYNYDLLLPRPNHLGQVQIAPKEFFEGDSYYLPMAQRREIIKVRTITESAKMNPQVNKLLTEIPPTVTNEGRIEIVEKPLKKLNEQDNKEEMLLNESPTDGIKVMF